MLSRMPSRQEQELDAVTLHNQALFNLDQQPPGAALAKLQFLLRQESFPAETFENLLLLYTKYEVRDRRTMLNSAFYPCGVGESSTGLSGWG